MSLVPDPCLSNRDTWRWCPDCGAIREPSHIHGDPLDEMSRDELLALVRVLRLAEAKGKA